MDACKNPNFCLAFHPSSDNQFSLLTNHSYYYQVQVAYCDFVIWSPNELVVLRISYQKSFIDTAITKATNFFKLGILPELIGRWFTKSKIKPSESEPTDCDKWCYCGLGEEGEMIACDDDDCPIVWFHLDCLKIDTVPDGNWFCPECINKH